MKKARIVARVDEAVQRLSVALHLRRFSHPVYIRRMVLGWQPGAFQKKTGITPTLLKRIESGDDAAITMKTMEKVADAFGISRTQLMYEIECWDAVEVTKENAERIAQAAFWAYSVEKKYLERDWIGGLTEEGEDESGAAEADDGE